MNLQKLIINIEREIDLERFVGYKFIVVDLKRFVGYKFIEVDLHRLIRINARENYTFLVGIRC